MERKHKSTCRSRLARIAGAALFCLFAASAPAAHAMLLELQFHWDASQDSDLLAYNLQKGSIIQVIAFNSTETDTYKPPAGASTQDNWDTVGNQFERYGQTSESASAAPYGTGHVPGSSDVYLADTTPKGHEIKYTGSIQNLDGWYGLYTQIQIDNEAYDTVYIRVFGATSFEQGEVTASYWGISATTKLDPTFQFQNWTLENVKAPDENANYFEVIPEPATIGLLVLGGCALAAWRRRRPRRHEEDNR